MIIDGMSPAEIKELYVDERKLLMRIQKIEEWFPKENTERVERSVKLLLYRIYSNLFSASVLTSCALQRKCFSFFCLPIGLVLRCAFVDCLFALYLLRLDAEQAKEELDLRTIEYVKSLFERKEVYRDQVRSVGIEFDDDFIDHLWELTMEDNFIQSLAIGVCEGQLQVAKRAKGRLKEEGFSKTGSIKTKNVEKFLLEHQDVSQVATRLYHYFKYFSQYEHFSENGQGDVLASLRENGNDNIHWSSAISALSAGVEKIVNDKRFVSPF